MTFAARRLHVKLLPAVAALFTAPLALGQTTSTQRAAAEALFQQGTALMDEKRYAEACDKFAGSQDLDPALGTMLYLADCYEQAGRTASAWALFKEAAETSKHAGQVDRERIATERASSLQQRLSKLELKVSPSRRVPGLELRLNDVVVPSASWNAPLPVDPGPLKIEARAPGKKPWRTQMTISQGPGNQILEVAQLQDAPVAPKSVGPGTGEAVPPRTETQRIVGYVIGAAGVVALGAGGFLGYRAYSLNKKSKSECRDDDPNACTMAGVDQREDAKSAAVLSTIVTASGGALVVGGLTLVLTAPSTAPSSDAPERSARRALPNVGLAVRGVW